MMIFFVIGLVFCPLAAACAFIITYAEYEHHYPDKRKPLEYATRMAVITFVVFLIISLLAGYLFSLGFSQ